MSGPCDFDDFKLVIAFPMNSSFTSIWLNIWSKFNYEIKAKAQSFSNLPYHIDVSWVKINLAEV